VLPMQSVDLAIDGLTSELFRRNCWISAEPVEGSHSVLSDYAGPHKIMSATDYPHPDGFFPGAPEVTRKQPEPLTAEAKHQVLARARWDLRAALTGGLPRRAAPGASMVLFSHSFETPTEDDWAAQSRAGSSRRGTK
jgi:hypothetical protein